MDADDADPYGVLGVPVSSKLDVCSKAYKKLALKHHPDRHVGAEVRWYPLTSAVRADVPLTQGCPANPPLPPPRSQEKDREAHAALFAAAAEAFAVIEKVDRRVFKKPVSEVRAFDTGAAVAPHELGQYADPEAPKLTPLWRCNACPEHGSTCCRINPPAKHRCVCSHKLAAHSQKDRFACADCRCRRYLFLVSMPGWTLKCKCKHAHTEHSPEGNRKCAKKGCDCEHFEGSWVCNCGHGVAEHSTVFSKTRYPPRARDWVTPGIRPECAKEAEDKRRKWAAKGRAPPGASYTAHVAAAVGAAAGAGRGPVAAAAAPEPAEKKADAASDGAGEKPWRRRPPRPADPHAQRMAAGREQRRRKEVAQARGGGDREPQLVSGFAGLSGLAGVGGGRDDIGVGVRGRRQGNDGGGGGDGDSNKPRRMHRRSSSPAF